MCIWINPPTRDEAIDRTEPVVAYKTLLLRYRTPNTKWEFVPEEGWECPEGWSRNHDQIYKYHPPEEGSTDWGRTEYESVPGQWVNTTPDGRWFFEAPQMRRRWNKGRGKSPLPWKGAKPEHLEWEPRFRTKYVDGEGWVAPGDDPDASPWVVAARDKARTAHAAYTAEIDAEIAAAEEEGRQTWRYRPSFSWSHGTRQGVYAFLARKDSNRYSKGWGLGDPWGGFLVGVKVEAWGRVCFHEDEEREDTRWSKRGRNYVSKIVKSKVGAGIRAEKAQVVSIYFKTGSRISAEDLLERAKAVKLQWPDLDVFIDGKKLRAEG